MESLNKFLIYVCAIALVYLGQTFFKIKQARQTGQFNWKELLNGLINHLIFFFGVMCVFFSGSLLPQVKVAIIDGLELTSNDALIVLAMGLYIRQSVRAMKNIKDEYKIDNVENIEEMPIPYPNEEQDR